MILDTTMNMLGPKNRPKMGAAIGLSILDGWLAAVIHGMAMMAIWSIFSNSFTTSRWLTLCACLAITLLARWYASSRAMKACQLTGAAYTREARMAIGEHLRRVPLGYFQKFRAGDLTSRLMGNLQDVESILTHLYTDLVTAIVSSISLALMLFWLDWRVALAALAVIPFMYPLMLLTQKLMAGTGRKRYDANGRMNDAFIEFLNGIRTLKAHGLDMEKLDNLKGSIDESRRVSIRLEALAAPIVGGFQLILELGLSFALLAGIALLSGGALDLPRFVLLAMVTFHFYAPLKTLATHQAELRNADQAAKTIQDVVNEPVQGWEGEGFKTDTPTLSFKEVSFSYRGDRQALDRVSFTVPSGQVVALVGASGSGKTTAANLAMRLWDASQGTISLDGNDIKTLKPEEVLAHMAVVFQDVYLFKDSVRANIAIAKEGATDADIETAAKAANAHDFIRALPQGYDTPLAEGGLSLSGGEKQRIAIARCILKDAPLVILDEATASLDPENERDIQEALARLLAGRTVLVIAHRLKTVRHAHKIVVLEKGRVVETGTHDELIATAGHYARMWQNQETSEGWSLKR